jgi:hypothetical protein
VTDRKGRGEPVKPATTIAIVLFSLISLIHVLRLFFRWEIVAAGFVVPLWFSVPGFIVAGGLAFLLWREMRG